MALGPFPDELPCPDCSSSFLRPHGFYQRYVQGRRERLRRGRCPRCGVTHAILPEDLCAYRDLLLEDLATVLEAPGPRAAARALGLEGEASRRRMRRWRREAREPPAIHAQAVLPRARADPWWRSAREAFGSLVAWRRWQWDRTRYLVTGLLGLLRHGRPPWRVEAASTEVGLFPDR